MAKILKVINNCYECYYRGTNHLNFSWCKKFVEEKEEEIRSKTKNDLDYKDEIENLRKKYNVNNNKNSIAEFCNLEDYL